MPDQSDRLRERLKAAVHAAERDQDLRREFQIDPKAALARFGVTLHPGGVVTDDGDVPPMCMDGTCFTSMCPDTCYVTVCTPSVILDYPGARVIDPAKAALPKGGPERPGGS